MEDKKLTIYFLLQNELWEFFSRWKSKKKKTLRPHQLKEQQVDISFVYSFQVEDDLLGANS